MRQLYAQGPELALKIARRWRLRPQQCPETFHMCVGSAVSAVV